MILQRMKNPSRRLPEGLAAGCAAVLAACLPAGDARADWIPSALDERCDPADVEGISAAIRDAIEASVRRAEAAIEAPHAIGDLSCLNDLMNAPLDIFSNLGGIMGSLQGGLSSIADFSFPIDLDVSGMVCDFAAQKWSELTQGLGDLDLGLGDFSATLSDPLGRLASGGGWGGSGGNVGRFSGAVNMDFRNRGTGTSDIDIPPPDGVDPDIFPDDEAQSPAVPVIDQAAWEQALARHEADVERARTTHVVCLTTRSIMLSNPDVFQSPPPVCPEPAIGPEPNPDDFIIAMAPAGGAAPASAPVFREQGQGGVSPSTILPEVSPPSGSGPAGGSGTPDIDSILQDIWNRL